MNLYVSRLRDGSKARENVKAEVNRNGNIEMKTIGISAAEGTERARTRAEAMMREIW